MQTEGSLPHSQVPATCPYPGPDQTSPLPRPTYWRSTLILSSHLCLCLPSGLFPSDFPTKTLHAPLPSPYVLHAPPTTLFITLPPEEYLVRSNGKFILMQSSPLLYFFVPFRSKYPPQQPILEYPQPMFLPQCVRPSFTPIQKNRQNYSFV